MIEPIKDTFVRDYLAAMPDGRDTEPTYTTHIPAYLTKPVEECSDLELALIQVKLRDIRGMVSGKLRAEEVETELRRRDRENAQEAGR